MSDNKGLEDIFDKNKIEEIIRDSFGVDKSTQSTIVIEYGELEAYTEFILEVVLTQASKLVREANFKPINLN